MKSSKFYHESLYDLSTTLHAIFIVETAIKIFLIFFIEFVVEKYDVLQIFI